LLLEDEIGSHQPAVWLQDPFEQHRGDGERRAGHHPVGVSGETEVRSICLDDGQIAPEPVAKMAGPVGVQFDGYNSSAVFEEGGGDRSLAGTDVEHQAGRLDAGASYEAVRPPSVKFVPSPPAWCRDHGGGRS
jgi:hypothetical protein